MQKQITIRGKVLSGKQLGRTLGFPTANVHLPLDQCRDQQMGGVWFGRVTLPDAAGKYWALINVGTRPTVTNDGLCKAEAWLIGFDGDLYGREITVDLLQFLRPELKFSSVEELRQAMEKDKQQAYDIIRSDEYKL